MIAIRGVSAVPVSAGQLNWMLRLAGRDDRDTRRLQVVQQRPQCARRKAIEPHPFVGTLRVAPRMGIDVESVELTQQRECGRVGT